MTRQQWKDGIESVGIVAIIASLIFVGIETRNSTNQAILTTQALEISAYQELMTNIEEMNMLTMQSDAAASTMRSRLACLCAESYRATPPPWYVD